jgi:ACS family hexuronate transporter-like MFS transporter
LPEPRERRAIPRLRYWILALLFLSTLVNYLDRQVLANLHPRLKEVLPGWNDVVYGRVDAAFKAAYAIGMTVSGGLLDRLGVRPGFAITIALWSLAAIAHALARGPFSFGACRALLGLGEAGNWPGATKAVGEWFAPKDRAFATGAWNMGSATGAIVAGPLVAWVAQYGWQYAFVLTGALGFVWLAAWLAAYRSPWRHPRVTREELEYLGRGDERESRGDATAATTRVDENSTVTTRAAEPSRWRELARRREVWGLVLARFVSDPVWWFYLSWLPDFLTREHGLTLTKVGLVSTIPYLTADFGSLSGGLFSSWLVRRGVPVLRARKTAMVASALLMPCAILAVRAHSTATAVAFVSVATFGHQCWASSMLTLPADLFRGRVVASASGWSGTGATIGGLLASVTIGVVVGGPLGYAPVFVWAGLMHPLAALIVLATIRARADVASPASRDAAATLPRPDSAEPPT